MLNSDKKERTRVEWTACRLDEMHFTFAKRAPCAVGIWAYVSRHLLREVLRTMAKGVKVGPYCEDTFIFQLVNSFM